MDTPFAILWFDNALGSADRNNRKRFGRVIFAQGLFKRACIVEVAVGSQKQQSALLTETPDFAIQYIARNSSLVHRDKLNESMFVPTGAA
ncbi:MAG: hypothetical protein DMF29_05970 [Verrucomicrobia bacterium]|nr:MAG: hypothetical protein DMF29_05970 [Verrucomicrobiota bacterium]